MLRALARDLRVQLEVLLARVPDKEEPRVWEVVEHVNHCAAFTHRWGGEQPVEQRAATV